jgi:carboxyl-terminal processing protease
VRADEADTAADRIRGPADSSVTLTVQSPGRPRRDVTVPRGNVTVSDALRGGGLRELELIYYRVPVITDPQLAATMAEHLLTTAAQFKARGIILDLRVAHSGGSDWPLPGMLTLFGDGQVGETYDRTRSEPLTVEGKDFGGSQNTPLVILIGPDTQGLPEILAGALRDAGRATLIGLPTPGAIQGYEAFPLPDGSRLFLATSSFRTSQGTDFASRGLQPDIVVNSDWDAVTTEADPVLEAAIAYLTE